MKPGSTIELGNTNRIQLVKIGLMAVLTACVVVVPFIIVMFAAPWFQQRWPQHWWMIPTILMGLLGALPPWFIWLLCAAWKAGCLPISGAITGP